MSPSQLRLIRVAGLGICFTLLFLRTVLMLQKGIFVACMARAWWLVPMVSYIVALWWSTSREKRSPRMQVLLLAVQSVSVLSLGFMMGGQRAANYLGYLLLLVTLQIVLTMPMRVALAWIVVQTPTLAVAYVVADHTDLITAAVSVIFKMFTYAIVVAMKREADERAQFAALHAEMIASRELHAERSRHNERLRIARDLHDVLGHRLTALSLNLEIASHKAKQEAGLDEIEYAQTLTKDLLGEVRDVVSVMRPTETTDLHAALQRVAQGFAPIRVHLQLPADLQTCDASRCEVLVRCAQELITNAVKHARARQVWIDLELTPDHVLHLRSHDDGAGKHTLEADMGVPRSHGTGLRSMRERFESFGGGIEASSDPQEGFLFEGYLPMLPAAA